MKNKYISIGSSVRDFWAKFWCFQKIRLEGFLLENWPPFTFLNKNLSCSEISFKGISFANFNQLVLHVLYQSLFPTNSLTLPSGSIQDLHSELEARVWWDGWVGYQKCPSIFFILCRNIQCFFFPVNIESVRERHFFNMFHAHFFAFTGTFWKSSRAREVRSRALFRTFSRALLGRSRAKIS